MIKGIKSYEERLQKLNFWSLEERRNRQDLIEVFEICKGLSRIRPEELFYFDDRGKGTRGHSLTLVKVRTYNVFIGTLNPTESINKVRCMQDSRRYFFLIEL